MSNVVLDRSAVLKWRNAVFVVFVLPGVAMASWVSRLPAVRDVFGLRTDQVGVLIFAIAIGSIIGLIASSHVVARFGARWTIRVGMTGVAVGVTLAGLGTAVGPSFALTFAGLLVFGVSTGATDVAMNVSGAANERALGRSIMPIFHAFFSFGTVLGAGLGALAELLGIPIAVHLAVVCVALAVTALTATRLLQHEDVVAEPADDDAPSEGWRSRLSIWTDRRVLLVGVIVLSAAFAEGTANDWLALAMVDGHGVDNATGALVFGVFVTAMTVGRLLGVLLLDRFGRVVVLRASFLLASAALLVVIFVPNPVVAGIACVLWGLGAALGFPIGMSAAADDPRRAAASVSAVATIGYFAFLVGPPAIGFLGEAVGLLNALIVVLVLCAVGALLAGAAREPSKR